MGSRPFSRGPRLHPPHGTFFRLGRRRFDGDWLPPLTFEPFDTLTRAGAASIRARVEALAPKEGHLVLFRGQKRPNPEDLLRVPADGERRERVFRGLVAGAGAIYRELEMNPPWMASIFPGVAEAIQRADTIRLAAKPIDGVAQEHQETNGGSLLVSASRSLSIAAGDYYFRAAKNRNPYIFLLQVPQAELVNVEARRVDKSRAYGHDPKSDWGSMVRESELAIWLDARPYLVGVYDTLEEAWIQPSRSAPQR